MDFKALVTAQLETNNVESELKNLCKDRDINLKVKIDDNEIKKIQDKIETINVDLGKILNVGSLNSVSQKIGEQIGNATRKGMSNAFSSKEIFKMSDLKKSGMAYMSKVSNTIEKQMGEIQKMANANGWKDFEITGIERANGQIKKLSMTVTDAEGAIKKLNFERHKLQGNGKAQYGLVQTPDVKIIKTAYKVRKEEAEKERKALDKEQKEILKSQEKQLAQQRKEEISAQKEREKAVAKNKREEQEYYNGLATAKAWEEAEKWQQKENDYQKERLEAIQKNKQEEANFQKERLEAEKEYSKIYLEAEKERKALDKSIEDYSDDFNTGKYSANLKQMENNLKPFENFDIDSVKNASKYLEEYNTAYSNLTKHFSGESVLSTNDLLNNFKVLETSDAKFKNTMKEVSIDAKIPKAIEDIKTKFSDVSEELKNFSSMEGLSKFEGTAGYQRIIDSIKKAEIAQEEFNKELEQGSNADFNKLESSLKEITSELKRAENQWDKLNASANTLDNIKAGNNTLSWLKNNTKAAKEYGEALKKLAEQQKNASTIGEAELYKKQVDSIISDASQKGLTGASLLDDSKRAFMQIAQFAGMYGIIQNVVEEIPRQMVQAVYEVDTAMTSLYKVTDETATRYEKFMTDAGHQAKELGRSMSSFIEQTAEWSKLGYTLNQSEELAKVSSIYANVGEVDDVTAVSDIVTTMKAFNIEATNAIDIIDQLNILGNKFATSSSDLGEGLQKSASAMNTAGTDLNHTLAMLTGGAEITQSAGEFGNFLKVASMRIRGMKGELEELGEEVDDSVDSISKVQTQILNLTHGAVNIFDDSGEFRDYFDIMEEISTIHDKLSSTEQASLDEILFGKQRGNQGAALIQAFQSGQIQKALEATYNAEGSAIQEQERWMESLEAKVQQFQAAFQDLSNTTLDSDFLKGIVDTGTNAIEVLDSLIDKIGLLGTIGAGVGIGALIKNFGISNEVALYGCESIVAETLKLLGRLNNTTLQRSPNGQA